MSPSDLPDTDPVYDGGMPAILERADARRTRLSFADGESLPPLDADLAALCHRETVVPPERDPISGNDRKWRLLCTEMQGTPEICCLHGLLVAHLRKRRFPRHAPRLFRRLWREHGDVLLTHLDLRWQVSAATTFADHGANGAQRSVGMGLTMLFGMMKLYETERLFAGDPADIPHALDIRHKSPLPMQMDGFTILRGDLDYNLLARLWREAETDRVIGPLAQNLLRELVAEDRGIFRRISLMRGEMGKRRRTNAG